MAAHVQTLSSGKNPFEKLGAFCIRYSLVLVLGWIGAMKFNSTSWELADSCVQSLSECIDTGRRNS